MTWTEQVFIWIIVAMGLTCGCLAPTVPPVSAEGERIIRANFAVYRPDLAAHAESRARQRFNASDYWRYTPAMWEKNWAFVQAKWTVRAYWDLLREEGVPNVSVFIDTQAEFAGWLRTDAGGRVEANAATAASALPLAPVFDENILPSE